MLNGVDVETKRPASEKISVAPPVSSRVWVRGEVRTCLQPKLQVVYGPGSDSRKERLTNVPSAKLLSQ